MKKHLSTIVMCVILVIGLSLLLYPTVSDYWNSFHQSRAVASYVEAVDNMDEETNEQLRSEAIAYNEALLDKENRWEMTAEEYAYYESVLDVTGTGIMGYVEIPSIQVQLPIYHGTDEEILQIAVGHIAGSSLPVGGNGTHAVISGHRGLPSARLFTDIDQLVEGDVFMLNVLGETMTYEVDQIRIVLPSEINDLKIDRDQDYVTLVTCTPYGVNTHRLLIRGHRIENLEGEVSVIQDATQVQPEIAALVIGIILLLLYILIGKIIQKTILFRFQEQEKSGRK